MNCSCVLCTNLIQYIDIDELKVKFSWRGVISRNLLEKSGIGMKRSKPFFEVL